MINNTFLKLIPILIPIIFISGPFLADLTTVILSIYFFYLVITKKIIFGKSFFIYFFSFFYLLIIISSIFSYLNNTFVSGGYLFYFRYPIFALMIFLIILKYPNTRFNIFWVINIIFLILFIDVLKEYFTGFNLLNTKRLVGNRVTSFFGDEPILGKYILFLLPLYIYLYLENISKIKTYIFYFFLFISSLIIFLSGERTALLLLAMFLIIYFTLCEELSFVKIFFLLTIPICLISIIFFDQEMYKRIIVGTYNTINIFNDPKKYSVNLIHYIDMFSVSYEIFKENYLIGTGPKSYRLVCLDYITIYPYSCNTHPHSIYLQLLSEMGVFAFIIFFSIWLLIVYYLFKCFVKKFVTNFKINKKLTILITNYFLVLFPFLPSTSFFNNWHNILFYFPLAFLLYEVHQSNSLNISAFGIKVINIKKF